MIHYILSDKHGFYIRHDDYSGKYVPVKNKSLADKWEQRNKAQNILKNCLSKQVRTRFHIEEVDDGIGICAEEDCATSNSNEKTVRDLHIKEVKEIISDEYKNDQMEKWKDGISSMNEFVQDAETRREQLAKDMSEIDKEITDIQHYIEFNNLNAYQGWLAYKMLQNRLKRRRKIKNELQVLTQLGNCKIDSTMLGEIDNAIREMDNRIYVPRVLKQLFD